MSTFSFTRIQILILAVVLSGALQAQTIAPPAIEWQQSFGASDGIWGLKVLQAPDGGYILAGNSGYTDSYEFWVLRLDPNGNEIWERTFGAHPGAKLSDFQPAHDGGWILGGVSSAPAGSGDKTSPLIGKCDFWMVHIDADGNKLWDRTYGRTNFELMSLFFQQTSDGGYILGGNVYTNTMLNSSAWLLRLDAAGNEVWNKILGGSGDDSCLKIIQTSDGGFLFGGSSSSSPSGNKGSPAYGGRDYWAVRLDSNGKKLWDNSFGGNVDEWFSSICATPDGGFFAAGSSPSAVSGNKTSQYYGGEFGGDYWLVRGNAEGTMLWNKSFGGSQSDKLDDMQPTADGGVVLCGFSASGVEGNRTSTNFGASDGWVVRLDRNGDKVWDQSFGSTNGDGFYSIKQTRDGGSILVGLSAPGVSGNKTTSAFGSLDLWVIKLAPDALSAPPRLRLQAQSRAEMQTNGALFYLSGVSNQLYRIEYSTDFRNWVPLQTNRAPATELEVVDSGATNSVRRYYRAQPMPE